MSALVWEHDQLDLYPVTKLLIIVSDLSVLFTSELPSFHGMRDLRRRRILKLKLINKCIA